MELLTILLLFLTASYSNGQCTDETEVLPNIHQRSINTTWIVTYYHDFYNIPRDGKWYSTEGYDILNKKDIAGEGMLICGNLYGVWVEGELPKHPGETVVLDTFTAIGSVTDHPINVTMCSDGTREYYLHQVNNLYSSYCFGKTNKTVFRPAYVRVNYSIEDGPQPEFKYHCEFEENSENLDTYYQVYWIVNDVTEMISDHFRLDGDINIQDFNTYKSDEKSKMININIKCGVLIHEGAIVNSFLSESFFAGIKVNEPIIYHEVGNIDAPILINLTLTIPYACPTSECNLPIHVVNVESQNPNQCGKNSYSIRGCHTEISRKDLGIKPYHTFDVFLERNLAFGKYHEYHLQLITGLPASIWDDIVLDPIKIIVHENSNLWKGKRCYSHNDPHMQTFDRRRYEHQSPHRGNYILYQQETADQVNMVEIALAECYTNILCNCGVAIRSGADVFKIDLCSGKGKINSVQCDDQQLKIFQRGLSFYQVFLPTGTFVEISFSSRFLNVEIIASPADVRSSTGLCGLLSDNCADDFYLRDGTFTSNTQQASNCGGHRDTFNDFSQSYRITAGSLFEDNINFPPKNKNVTYCLCSKNNADLKCTKSLVSPCIFKRYAKEASCRIEDKSIGRRRKKRHVASFQPKLFETFKRTKRNAEDAYIECKEFMESSEAFVACQKILPNQANSTIEECATDVQLTDSDFWRNQSHDSFINACFGEIILNEALTSSNDSEQLDLVNNITKLLCPGNPICSGNGNCIDRKCVCHYGFIGSDCSASFSEPPEIQNLHSDGICDISKVSCQNISVLGFEYYDSPNMTCKLKYFKIHHNQSWVFSNDPVLALVDQETFVEVSCPIPTSRAINISENILVHGYMISLSYDGINYSDEHDYFIYDGTCVEHTIMSDDNVTFTLQEDYCFIDGICHNHGQKNVEDSNFICDTSLAQDQWTILTKISKEKNVQHNKWLVPVVVSIVIFVVVAVGVAVVMYKVGLSQKSKVTDYVHTTAFPRWLDTSNDKKYHYPSPDQSLVDLQISQKGQDMSVFHS